MSLITCIECGKQISDKSISCPNCGCPTEASLKERKDNIDQNEGSLKYKCPVCGTEYPTENYKCHTCGYISYTSKSERIKLTQNQQNTPKCPTCQSTNIKKISATSKATNAVLFGLFGNKRNKQFHCNNCGYDW